MKADRHKSLQQLDGQDWGEPTYDSHLVIECHRLRRVPLHEFTIANLRIMIGQNIGLEHLVPLALERLDDNPFAEGDCYPCDLLTNVLKAEPAFWQAHPKLLDTILTIAGRAIAAFPTMPDFVSKTVTRSVIEAYDRLQTRRPSPSS